MKSQQNRNELLTRLENLQQQASIYNPSIQLANPNFWQASTDELLFGTPTGSSNPSKDLFSTSAPGQAPALQQLSSSVPLIANPLSDILTELNPGAETTTCATASTKTTTLLLKPNATSPPPLSVQVVPSPGGAAAASAVNQVNVSPSQVGPTRHSTLHRLLMQRGKSDVAAAQAAAQAAAAAAQQGPGVGGGVTATKSRPSPVRSPEARKTLDQMRNSLSLSSGGISASMLSRSAPSGRILSCPIGQHLKSAPKEDFFYVTLLRYVSCFSR